MCSRFSLAIPNRCLHYPKKPTYFTNLFGKAVMLIASKEALSAVRSEILRFAQNDVMLS
ncbi:MAG: hypothetical protein ACUVTY_06085 [Armatimonadota bacterium]